MLVCKHRVKQALSHRTRSISTLIPYDQEPITLAKGNITAPGDKADHNAYVSTTYISRQPGDKTTSKRFNSTRDMWTHEEDLIQITQKSSLNMEYDFKREPVNPIMAKVGDKDDGIKLIAFHSIPWKTVEDAETARAFFKGWRVAGHCLKTLEDWDNWRDYYTCSIACKGTGIKRTKSGSAGLLLRMFLRAYTREAWGLSKSMTYIELALWLTREGFKTSDHTVKNAQRPASKLEEGVVPYSPEMMVLLKLILVSFPEFNLEKLFSPADYLLVMVDLKK